MELSKNTNWRKKTMAKYNYDFDTMVKKMREIWTPEDFLRATEKLMYAGYIKYEQTSQVNLAQNKNNTTSNNSKRIYTHLTSTNDFSTEKDFAIAA